MKRPITIIVIIGLGWVLVNLPAGLIRQFVNSEDVTLVAPKGSIWRGSAQLVTTLGLQGQVKWQTTLLPMGIDFRFIDQDSDLRLRIDPGFAEHRLSVSGQLDANSLAPLLSRYDLFVPGTFTVDDIELRGQTSSMVASTSGKLQWSGGLVRYILANRRYQAELPPLQAIIQNDAQQILQANVSVKGSIAPDLMVLRLQPDNSIYIGVRLAMLRLANFPWSGDEPEDELIFEVERSLL